MVEVPIQLIKWWMDILNDELSDCPTAGLTNMYESICGLYQKYKGDKE